MAAVTLEGQVVSMAGEAAERLIRLGQGDAALLYVALLRRGGELREAAGDLGWSRERLRAAYGALQSAGLVGAAPADADTVAQSQLPEYVTGDIVTALAGDAGFAAVKDRMEQLLGTILSPADLKQLYTIYDFLALPPEVICVLGDWCVAEMERKYGPGRRPRMSQIKKQAFRWREQGIDTLAAAEAFLKSQTGLRERERELLPRLGVRDRAPMEREREYLGVWIDWGFPDEAILLAYEKTLLKKQSMSWAYMNAILKSWHGKGLHSLREIEAAEARQGKPAAPAARPGQGAQSRPARRVAEDLAELKRAAGKRS